MSDSSAVLPGKKVTVLGLGVSGYLSALYLQRQGYQVSVSDEGDGDELQRKAKELSNQGIFTETRGHTQSEILKSNWILISPGIPPSAPIYRAIVHAGIPILSEIEVASCFCPAKRIIGVTGTCGKTTVTTLLQKLMTLSGDGGRTVSCGNIGNPWIGEVDGLTEQDTVVLELSSFQLEHCHRFRPSIGILLNLSPNHEDWHPDNRAYVNAKLRLFQAQTNRDYAILRKQDENRYFPEHRLSAKTVYFASNPALNPNEEILKVVAGILNISEKKVAEVLENFQGIEHRLELFHSAHGVSYVNDSKSTTPASLAWALDKYAEQKVILIAGGHPKSTDFDSLKERVRQKVKKAILIGEARPLMRAAWGSAAEVEEAETLAEAIDKALQSARSGDVVLLSPACASFDMFRHYQERGRLFKEGVLRAVSAQMGHSEGMNHV